MNYSTKCDHLTKFLNIRMVIIEVEIAETNEEAWLRHLATNPEDFSANIRIFNHKKNVQKTINFEIKAPK